METIIQRLERLYLTDNWDKNDKDWLFEYLKGDISELYLIALDGFSKDVLEKKIILNQQASDKILSNIHRQIKQPKQKFNIRLWGKIAIAASIAGVFCTGFLFRKQLDNFLDPVKYEQTVALKGELKMIQLADGTSILLNADSRLSYPDHFKEDTREVTLTGEAYFKVVHDATKPFIVHSCKINTMVLGTSFNIKAYKDDKTIKVTVVTGKVGVLVKESSTKQRSVLLTPNMQAVFNKNSEKLANETLDDASLVIGWSQGKLQYRNTPLPDVLADLRRKYNVVINADKNLQSCTLYADFNNLSLQKVLKIIGTLINARTIKEGNGYRLRGRGCG